MSKFDPKNLFRSIFVEKILASIRDKKNKFKLLKITHLKKK